ncbi:trypsin-like serine protease [Streptomyces sp. SP18CS02]|uniref:trypsin-like serine protease n=1 Tax=Streptomyces sp. SP18CS02 TaxID=3002531 RepID=UPI002E76097D|nr:trypsin-like serine protease [Streptomyces sp. SP18CS02]MEE1752889.1 trypsin-like serine protease [Streptomyces sp. SP18CS02]
MKKTRKPRVRRTATAVLLSLGVALGMATPSAQAVEGGTTIESRWGTGMAQVWEMTAGGPAYRCSGSVVGPIKVLTAAHCFRPGVDYTDFYVLIGHTEKGKGHRIRIGNVNKHKDLAVASLTADVTRYPEAHHVALNTKIEPAHGQYAHVQGWGRTCLDCFGSTHLKQARVRVIDYGTDLVGGPAYRVFGSVKNGALREGDSGGPMMWNGRQVGVVSDDGGPSDPNHAQISLFDDSAERFLTDMHVPVNTAW